jgi:hypothetical protein
MKVRRRLVGSYWQTTRTYHNGQVTQTIKTPPTAVSTREQLLFSQGHPYHILSDPKRKPKKPKRYKGKNPTKIVASNNAQVRYAVRLAKWRIGRSADIGGNFDVRKCIPAPAFKKINDFRSFGPNDWITSNGEYMTTALVGSDNVTIQPSSNSQLDAYGTSCIARCLPTNPLANMGQFLVELRDLPRIFNPWEWKEKARTFRGLAEHGSSEYLNVVFGWLPFINDINSFFKVTDNYQKIIQQYDRDSGRHVRRNAKLFDTTNTVSSVVQTNAGPFPTPSQIVSGGTLSKDVITKQRVWFKGSFTYYLPPIDGSVHSYYARYSAYASKLYGLSLSPDLLWKVTPWTWAIDWLSNTGSVIRNYDAFHNQGLVMHYGYVMEEKIVATKYRLDGFKLRTNPLTSLEDYTFQLSRVRRKATPYGFGLNPGSFTPFQNGVIAALGINRTARWF